MIAPRIISPPHPARKLLKPTTIRVGSGSFSPGPSNPRKINSNCGMTKIIMTATTATAMKITAAG